MDGLQAAILNVKLPYLATWTEKRRKLATHYGHPVSDVSGLLLPSEADGVRHVWHIFQVRTENRDGLAKHLAERDIQTSVNYPRALPFLPCYRDRCHMPEEFPISHSLSKQTLSLPLFPEMTKEQQAWVVQGLWDWSGAA